MQNGSFSLIIQCTLANICQELYGVNKYLYLVGKPLDQAKNYW